MHTLFSETASEATETKVTEDTNIEAETAKVETEDSTENAETKSEPAEAEKLEETVKG